MVPVHCSNQMRIHSFESCHLEGSYVGYLLYFIQKSWQSGEMVDFSLETNCKDSAQPLTVFLKGNRRNCLSSSLGQEVLFSISFPSCANLLTSDLWNAVLLTRSVCNGVSSCPHGPPAVTEGKLGVSQSLVNYLIHHFYSS